MNINLLVLLFFLLNISRPATAAQEITRISGFVNYLPPTQDPFASKDGNVLVENLKNFGEELKDAQVQETFFADQKEIARRTLNAQGDIIEESGNIPDGIVKEYYKNGALKAEVSYIKNRPQGPEISYFKNGKVAFKANYQDGKLEGQYEKYYEGGQLREQGSFARRKLNGLQTMYYETGEKRLQQEYKSGMIEGISKTYDKKGNLGTESLWQNGKLISAKVFDKNGNLISANKH